MPARLFRLRAPRLLRHGWLRLRISILGARYAQLSALACSLAIDGAPSSGAWLAVALAKAAAVRCEIAALRYQMDVAA